MGSTTTQTQQTQYNQPSMNAFNSLQPGVSNTLNAYMNSPYSSGLFNLKLQQSLAQANQLGQRGASNVAQNLQSGGFGGGNLNAFQSSMLNSAARNQSALASIAYQNALLGSQQLQLQATQGAMGYRPLATGQTNQQTQSGLGTWLPQVAGLGLGLATGGVGALGMGLGGAAGAASSGLNIGPNSFGMLASQMATPMMAGTSGTFGGGPAFGSPLMGGAGSAVGMPNPFAFGGH